MKTTTIKENNNTMQFRPDKVDCTYIKEHSMIKLNSFYFSSSTVKFFNSKIKRVFLYIKKIKAIVISLASMVIDLMIMKIFLLFL